MIQTSTISRAISELLNKYTALEAENAALKIKVVELTSTNSAMDFSNSTSSAYVV